jgi:hypothetical protein
MAKYANIKNPNIEAVAEGRFRFANKAQAVERLEVFRENFILSRKHPDSNKKESIILWIRGYSITPEEFDKGYLGNYALFSIHEAGESKFTLQATKLDSELKYHPQRHRPKRQHPNWGHPVMRGIKKGKRYPSIEAAEADLQKLHEEFPTVSIPANAKLYTMVFSRQDDSKNPVKKYVLEIESTKEGDFIIVSKPNNYESMQPSAGGKSASGSKGPQAAVPTAPTAPKGKFTAMVELKRSKRGKKAPAPRKKPEGGAPTDSTS